MFSSAACEGLWGLRIWRVKLFHSSAQGFRVWPAFSQSFRVCPPALTQGFRVCLALSLKCTGLPCMSCFFTELPCMPCAFTGLPCMSCFFTRVHRASVHVRHKENLLPWLNGFQWLASLTFYTRLLDYSAPDKAASPQSLVSQGLGNLAILNNLLKLRFWAQRAEFLRFEEYNIIRTHIMLCNVI